MTSRLEADLKWKSIKCPSCELSLDFTLEGGQSFRWHKMPSGAWRGVFARRIWTISQDGSDDLRFTTVPRTEEAEQLLRNYFQLDVKLADLYEEWCERDAHFAAISPRYRGVRVLRQDPVENLFSFLCSSNNNISRITGMVESLCSLYGDVVGEMDGRVYYSFPTVQRLANDGTEMQLKERKFGYRASYIARSAHLINETKSADWLNGLRTVPYQEAHGALLQLPGVGHKVADCVCLMSLDKTQSVPVDTHIFQVAAQAYLHRLKPQKTVTEKVYKEIGDHFRKVFGTHAGWAHSVLFTSDLAKFKVPHPVETIAGKKSKDKKPETPLRKSKKVKKS